MAKMAKTIVFLAALAALAGCQVSLSPGEIVYQTVHAVDVAQTVRIARHHETWHEVGMGTCELIGAYPTVPHVLEWGVGSALIHFAVDDYLYVHNHPKLALAFESVTIAFAVDTVHNNYRIGLGYGF